MFSNIVLVVVTAFFAGLMFYMFFTILFSRKDYKNMPKPGEKKASSIPDSKLKGKFIGRT